MQQLHIFGKNKLYKHFMNRGQQTKPEDGVCRTDMADKCKQTDWQLGISKI